VFAKRVWDDIKVHIDCRIFPDSWDLIMVMISDPLMAPKTLLHKLTLAATVYMIWHERNERLFTDARRSVPQITKDIFSIGRCRMLRRQGESLLCGTMMGFHSRSLCNWWFWCWILF